MSVRNRFGRRVALFALAFSITPISSIAYGEGVVQRSIPGETVTRPIYISSCDNHWVSDGNTTISSRGYAQVRLTSGAPVYAAAGNSVGALIASQAYVGSTGANVTFFNNTYRSIITFSPSLCSVSPSTVYPTGTWTFVSQ
jgi:hypothetical protein